MSNPSLPPAPAPVPPPPMGAAASSSSPRRRRRVVVDSDDEDAHALEEGELRVPFPVGHESASDSDTEDDGGGGDEGGRRYLFQPRADYNDPDLFRRPQHQHRSPQSPRRRRRCPLSSLDILLLGAGSVLPSPTPPSAEEDDSDSEGTLSDLDHGVSPSSAAAADAVDRGWAATGKRGWMAGGNKIKNQLFLIKNAVVLDDVPSTPAVSSDLHTVSASGGDGHAGGATSGSAQAAHQLLPPAPRRRQKRERPTEYTCKECGKSYPNNQALGGHAAGHKNKQREAAAMAAAMAAAGGEGDVSGAAFLQLRRGGGGGGKAADKPHECRVCGKVFASGVALGGHMRVHYTGPPIVPARKGNKKRCLAPPPSTPAEAAGLSLSLSIKAEGNIAAARPPAAAAGLSLALSVKAEEEPPSTTPPPPAVPAVVRLFGIDISPQGQQAPAPLQLLHQGSGDTAEDSLSTDDDQQQH